jgi:hypothetical protein
MGMRERWVFVWLLFICLCVLGSMVQARSNLRGHTGPEWTMPCSSLRFSFFMEHGARRCVPYHRDVWDPTGISDVWFC